jgi:hypothetical protein
MGSDYPSTFSPTSPNERGGIIQSPDIPKTGGEPEQRSIKDIAQAKNVVQLIIQASRNRSIVNARIMAKVNAERPYSQAELETFNLGWRQNFTTKPLPSLIEKVAPRYVEAINKLKYFTNVALPDKYDNCVEKSEKFRKLFTEIVRKRKGFTTLVEDVAFINALFGYTAVAWLDQFCWFPAHFQQDQLFLPDGTKAESRKCQVLVLKEVLLPHELFAFIKDKDAAKDMGWNIENTVTVINNAAPSSIREAMAGAGTLEMWYQNAIRELTLGASYMAGANTVVVYHLFATEATGKVSHYQMAGDGMEEIFNREDQYDSMEDAAAFFSFQKGNGTMHGSKGIGRELYELAGMIDRSRNEVVDRTIMSGKMVVQGDIKKLHSFQMSVVGMCCIIPNGWNLLEKQAFNANVEDFVRLDGFFTQISDQLIGNVSVPQAINAGESMRSPAAWNVVTEREEESRDVKISRFLEQMTVMFQTMQKRVCNPDTNEEDAKEFQLKLKEFLTDEEIQVLALQPVSETIRDLTPLKRQMISAIAAEKKGNPLYNARQLEVQDLVARVDAEFANNVLLPGNDPSEQAEQMREQQLENILLSQGAPVPVSARDNHQVHLSIVFPVTQQIAQGVMTGQGNTKQLEALGAHVAEHFNRALEQGVKQEMMPDVADFVKKFPDMLQKLNELDQQAAQLHNATQMHDAESEQIAAGPDPMQMPQDPGLPAGM